MKKVMLFIATALFCSFFIAHSSGAGKGYKVSLAQMPVYAESTDKGVLVDLVKAMAEASGVSLSIQVVPFARSMDEVTKGYVDFHMPLIRNPNIADKSLPYLHSTVTIFHVNFVLYTLGSKPLDMSNLGKYKIETDGAHTQYFPFPTIASYSLESSLKKLNAGRIDGFIFADTATDPLIPKLGLTNIKRALYKRFEVKVILPRNDKSAEIDSFLTETIAKMRASGKYQKIMNVLDQPFK